MMRRMNFKLGLAWFVTMVLCAPLVGAAAFRERGPAYLRAGPMVGHVTSSNAFIWAQASRPGQMSVRVSVNPDLSNARTIRGDQLKLETGVMGSIQIKELKPQQRYFYCVLLEGKPAMTRPYPFFETPALEGAAGRVRFAFTSCVGNWGRDAAAGYADMAARTNMDLLFMLGDNHYANTNDPIRQREFYFDQRRQPGWRELTEDVPTYAVWDDHDYGPDNSDGTLPKKEVVLQTFKEHWANPFYGEPGNPGVYCNFTRGEVEFFLLDVRYYRTPNKLTNAPNRTMLGERQKEWLKRTLAASRAKVKVIASGSEFQSDGTVDGWRNFKQERDEILQHIEDNRIEGVLFISGDRHFTAAYQIKGKWIEATAGPIGSTTITSRQVPEMFLNLNPTNNPTKSRMYCVYDINTGSAPPNVTLEVYKVGEGLAFRRRFTWEEVLGVSKIIPEPAAKK